MVGASTSFLGQYLPYLMEKNQGQLSACQLSLLAPHFSTESSILGLENWIDAKLCG